jgi:cytochrome c553
MAMVARAVRAAALAAALGGPVGADMISSEGLEPWEVCGLCHGLNGLSAMAKFPRLAGQKPAYIEKQLADFAGGRRTNDGGQMAAIATEIAAADYARVAAWFAGQTPPEPDAPQGDAVAGAAVWAARGCAECHHAGATPDGHVAPWLFAQHERYLRKQLTDFRDGWRDADPEGVMRARAAELSDADIAALAAYLAGTPRP